MREGEERQKIRERVEECIGPDEECQKLRELLRDILLAIATAIAILAIPESVFFAGLLAVLRAAATLIPRLRPVVALLERIPAAEKVLLQIEQRVKDIVR